jgi:glycosidase
MTDFRMDYLHIFAKGQPDLNWESKEVRKEIHESALRFWLKKGVDGFRVSAPHAVNLSSNH